MFLTILSGVLTAAAAVHWYQNRHKPTMYILSEFWHSLGMKGAGAGGLIDDWINKRRNKFELPDASGKIAVVTGGARGIGTEIVRGLLKANATVIVGVRKPEAAHKLAETAENGHRLHAFQLDLQSLKSVKEFAKNVTEKFPKIDLLVNNAGIMFGEYKLTEDGFESQLAVNHLGHFLLTHLLLPALKKGGKSDDPARVVSVSSCAHHPGKIYFDDINMKKHYDENSAYSQSKLAQIMTTRYINKMMEDEGSKVKCYSVHPGIVNTDLFDGSFFKNYLPWAMRVFFKTPQQGSQSIFYACFEKELEKRGGLYISNCQEGISNRFSKNFENQKKLYLLSCELVGLDYDQYKKH